MGTKKPILAIFCTWSPCLGTKLCPYELIFHAHIEENSTDHNCFKKKMILSSLFRKNLKVKIFDLTVELYCKVKNLNFQISLNQLDKIIYFIKQRLSVLFSSIFAWNMSTYGHSLVPKYAVQVPKTANIGFFAPKPYLKGIDPDFLFHRKFCLVEILKRWKGLSV